jgi:hypothetical protein
MKKKVNSSNCFMALLFNQKQTLHLICLARQEEHCILAVAFYTDAV